MSIETLKRAAELLRESVQYRPEQYDPYFADHEKETNAIAAELEAMAEHLTPRPIPGWEMADQKPVAWIDPNNLKEVLARETGALRYLTRTPSPGDVPLYIAPQPRIPEGWEMAAESWRDVEAFCRQHPGERVTLLAVPIEPTPEMLDAVSWPNAAKTDYAHTLAAAPKPEMKE